MITSALTRLAGSLFGGDETTLAGAPLIEAAARTTGLDPAPLRAPHLVEALDALTESLRSEAALSPFGVLGTRWDLGRLLRTVLILHDEETRDPLIAARSLAPPIFVSGLPRSGTTFLHALLACDPAHRAAQIWETIHPYPTHRAAERGAGPRRVQRQLRVFERLAPGVGRLHPMDAAAPQECTEIASHIFRSLRFDTTHHVPGYRAWLDRSGHDEAYRFQARFLRHLQGEDDGATPRRWVLKSPDHVFSAAALARVFPAAHLVLVHRDPAHVLASVARLTELLRAPFTDAIDRAAIGRKVAADWQDGMRRMVALADDPRFALRDRLVHVHYDTLVAEPRRTVERIYQAMGWELGGEARARIDAHVARAPRGGYGDNRYAPEEYGLQPARERERAQGYVERFGVGALADGG